jgi:hypothetical protein
VPIGAPVATGEAANLARSFPLGPATAGLPAASSSLAPPLAAAGFTSGDSPSPTADPALRLFQAAADDESLHAAVLGSSAHLRVQTATGEDLSLHLRVRDGIADVRVERTAEVRATGPTGVAEAAEPRAELKASEVQAALASEGLALGRFESSTAPQDPHWGDGGNDSARAAGIPALESRASSDTSAFVAPAPTVGNPRAERVPPPAIRLATATAMASGGALRPRPVSGNTGRASGYDLGGRRPGLDEAARVVAGVVEIASNAVTSGTSAGANPNLDQHPNPNQTPYQGPNHPGATSGAAHATGGPATETYSSPHQHHQRHPHREGAAESDGARRQRTSAPARVASITIPGPRDPQTTAIHSDGTPSVHVTA